MRKYIAIVNGEIKYISIPGKKMHAPAGSKENFFLSAETTEQALITARRELQKRGIREKKFKGVVEIKNNKLRLTK